MGQSLDNLNTRGTAGTCLCGDGFTLLELLIAMAISMVVIFAIYDVYITQVEAAAAQEKIVAMRQNWRSGNYVIGRELMKAGYSSHITSKGNPGFTRALKGAVTFTYVDDATDALRSIALELKDGDGDGDTDIVRTDADGAFSVADDIEALEFVYQMKDGTTTWTPAATALNDIRAIRVTILAKTSTPVKNYPQSTSFALPFPDGEAENTFGPYSDGVYRQLITGFYVCRNMTSK